MSAPRWTAPTLPAEAELANRLILNNSLSEEKAPFVTIDPNQKIIRWYICGPTVYDSAHLGHARAYVTFDIIARLLTEYFGYELIYVMNITDIDDKIILRARRNHLLKDYVAKVSDVAVFEKEVLAAVKTLLAKREATVKDLEARPPPKTAKAAEHKDWDNRVKEAKAKFGNILTEEKSTLEALAALKKVKGVDRALVSAAASAAYDSVTEWLDKLHGDSVSDQQIFRAHAAYYENEFLEDMKSLGVREPTVLTRVSEYVDKIVAYIQKIISEGVAYESNGSVYFDVARFSESHWYAKLAPEHRDNLDLAEEGEGAIGSAASDKRNPADFALWKKSKSGEPFWESPWGKGRPGWHIECSVMASDILGSQIDIHSGGIDLKFPHHDNELAQAEAHDHSQQWINYFLHAGHLGMDGLKMSKSLKNFRTIREILKNYSARVLRLFFLSVAWDGPMNFSEQPLAEAAAKDKQLKEFFLNVKAAIRSQGTIGSVSQHWDNLDRQLHEQLLQIKTDVHKALLANFNFPRAFQLLFALVDATNKYLKDSKGPKALLLKSVATYAHKILRSFGVIPFDDFGFNASSGEASASGTNEDALAPYLNVLAAFRDEIRTSSQKKLDHKVLLQLCDKLRDEILPELGVRLEDRPDGTAVWKLENAEALKKERADKLRAALSQQISKLSNKVVLKKKDLDRSLESSKSPAEKFAEMKKYSKYDDKGVPTHDADGKELSKPQRKNAEKDHSNFEKAYEKHQQAVAKDPEYIKKLQQEIAEIETELKALEAQQAPAS